MTASSRARKAKLQRKPTSKGFLFLVIVLAVLGLFFAFTLYSGPAPESRIRSEARYQRYLQAKSIIEESGASTTFRGDLMEITLPHDLAMSVSKREAGELATIGRDRVGVKTVVRTPAGQVIFETE